MNELFSILNLLDTSIVDDEFFCCCYHFTEIFIQVFSMNFNCYISNMNAYFEIFSNTIFE